MGDFRIDLKPTYKFPRGTEAYDSSLAEFDKMGKKHNYIPDIQCRYTENHIPYKMSEMPDISDIPLGTSRLFALNPAPYAI